MTESIISLYIPVPYSPHLNSEILMEDTNNRVDDLLHSEEVTSFLLWFEFHSSLKNCDVETVQHYPHVVYLSFSSDNNILYSE